MGHVGTQSRKKVGKKEKSRKEENARELVEGSVPLPPPWHPPPQINKVSPDITNISNE